MAHTEFEIMTNELKTAFNARFEKSHIRMHDLTGGNVYHVSSLDFRFSTDGSRRLCIDAHVAGDGRGIALGSDSERLTDTLPNGETVAYYCYTLRNILDVVFNDMSFAGIEAVTQFIIGWFNDHEDFYTR